MKVCIQDPRQGATYLIDEEHLDTFAIDSSDSSRQVDVLFVMPSSQLVQELPASRLSDSATPSVQIVDPDRNRQWVLSASELGEFKVSTPPDDAEDVAWFAMPTARELVAAVPVFRKALVQHSS